MESLLDDWILFLGIVEWFCTNHTIEWRRHWPSSCSKSFSKLSWVSRLPFLDWRVPFLTPIIESVSRLVSATHLSEGTSLLLYWLCIDSSQIEVFIPLETGRLHQLAVCHWPFCGWTWISRFTLGPVLRLLWKRAFWHEVLAGQMPFLSPTVECLKETRITRPN